MRIIADSEEIGFLIVGDTGANGLVRAGQGQAVIVAQNSEQRLTREIMLVEKARAQCTHQLACVNDNGLLVGQSQPVQLRDPAAYFNVQLCGYVFVALNNLRQQHLTAWRNTCRTYILTDRDQSSQVVLESQPPHPGPLPSRLHTQPSWRSPSTACRAVIRLTPNR